MTEREMKILLTTVYKGDGANKLVSDLDKISSSGEKASGVIQKMEKTLGAAGVFQKANATFRKNNPDLFPPESSSSPDQAIAKRAARYRVTRLPTLPPIIAEYEKAQRDKEAALLQGDQARFLKNAIFGLTPLAAPTSLLGNFFAARQMFAGLSDPNNKTGQKVLGSLGLSGTGGAAAATAGIMTVLLSVGLALKGLEKVVKGVTGAFEQARNLYSKALTSGGLGLGFTARRETLAAILGVSAKDVYQFGQAVLYLNPKIEWASNIIAKTTPSVAGVAFQFQILKFNLEALFMSLASDAAPLLRQFADGLSNIIRIIQSHRAIIEWMLALGASGIAATIASIARLGKDAGPAPQPLAFMQQMRASAAEHMGFVVGNMGFSNPAVQTARNTKRAADSLDKIVRHFGKSTSFYDPFQTSQSYP